MTNYEHYKEQTERIARLGRSVAMNATTGEIVCCGDINCNECLFQGSGDANCSQKAFKWADEEYKDDVDWSKIPLDTPVLVSNDKKIWVRRHLKAFIVSVWATTLSEVQQARFILANLTYLNRLMRRWNSEDKIN